MAESYKKIQTGVSLFPDWTYQPAHISAEAIAKRYGTPTITDASDLQLRSRGVSGPDAKEQARFIITKIIDHDTMTRAQALTEALALHFIDPTLPVPVLYEDQKMTVAIPVEGKTIAEQEVETHKDMTQLFFHHAATLIRQAHNVGVVLNMNAITKDDIVITKDGKPVLISARDASIYPDYPRNPVDKTKENEVEQDEVENLLENISASLRLYGGKTVKQIFNSLTSLEGSREFRRVIHASDSLMDFQSKANTGNTVFKPNEVLLASDAILSLRHSLPVQNYDSHGLTIQGDGQAMAVFHLISEVDNMSREYVMLLKHKQHNAAGKLTTEGKRAIELGENLCKIIRDGIPQVISFMQPMLFIHGGYEHIRGDLAQEGFIKFADPQPISETLPFYIKLRNGSRNGDIKFAGSSTHLGIYTQELQQNLREIITSDHAQTHILEDGYQNMLHIQMSAYWDGAIEDWFALAEKGSESKIDYQKVSRVKTFVGLMRMALKDSKTEEDARYVELHELEQRILDVFAPAKSDQR